MTNNQKQQLLGYLYPTEDIRKFMCNDLYQELDKIIPKNICISPLNLNNKVRSINYNKVKDIIENFLLRNHLYLTELSKLNVKYNLDDIIMGYVFYSSVNSETEVDIFKNKKSICYTEVFFLDVLYNK